MIRSDEFMVDAMGTKSVRWSDEPMRAHSSR